MEIIGNIRVSQKQLRQLNDMQFLHPDESSNQIKDQTCEP